MLSIRWVLLIRCSKLQNLTKKRQSLSRIRVKNLWTQSVSYVKMTGFSNFLSIRSASWLFCVLNSICISSTALGSAFGRPRCLFFLSISMHSTRCLNWIHSNNKECFKKNVSSQFILCCHQYTSRRRSILMRVSFNHERHISYCGCHEVLIELSISASLFSHSLGKIYFVSKCMWYAVDSLSAVDSLFKIAESHEKTTISFKNSS